MSDTTIKSLADIPAVKEYMERIGAEARGLRTMVVVRHMKNYWRDTTVLRISDDGEVRASAEIPGDASHLLPTLEEAAEIKEAVKTVRWPVNKSVRRLTGDEWFLKDVSKEDVFPFLDRANNIRMVQVRGTRERADGEIEKCYRSFSYWSDDQWRATEPDGKLPLFNLNKVRDTEVVFIHEGAKAAAYVQWMVDSATREASDALAAHPWGRELCAGPHVGWIGGALSPYRTDWAELSRCGVHRAYIVSDNDEPGRSAVPRISQHLDMVTIEVSFQGKGFPPSFDLADQFPDEMFRRIEGKRFYTGLPFSKCLEPATWITNQYLAEDGKKVITEPRQHLSEVWAWVSTLDRYLFKEKPSVILDQTGFDGTQQLFKKGTKSASHLIKMITDCKYDALAYAPGQERDVYIDGTGLCFNRYTPSAILPAQGDATPFIEFMEYLIPDEAERSVVLRWCATLIARPQVRIGFALLMISNSQGTGKTTLGEHILAPLVGTENVSRGVSEKQLLSDETTWVANKRLAIIGEIYAAKKRALYNELKSIISDDYVSVNEKYVPRHTLQNWIHIYACSNSHDAVSIEEGDRRWYVPRVTEEIWPKEKFDAFYDWLDHGGLNIIMNWAERYGDYYTGKQIAPNSYCKVEMIEEGMSYSKQDVKRLAEVMVEFKEPLSVKISDVLGWVRVNIDNVRETNSRLRKVMKSVDGIHELNERIKIGGSLEYVLFNSAMAKKIDKKPSEERNLILRNGLRRCSEIADSRM